MTDTQTKERLTVELDGIEYPLRPSFEALTAIERQTDASIMVHSRAAAMGTLSTSSLAAIVAECIKAEGRHMKDDALVGVNAKRIGELIYETPGGTKIVMQRVLVLLMMATTGHYTAQGDIKPDAEAA